MSSDFASRIKELQADFQEISSQAAWVAPMDTGYVATVYNCRMDSIIFLLCRDYDAAERLGSYERDSGSGKIHPCYLPLEIDLRKYVQPENVTDWPVRILPSHPGYLELRQRWFDTVEARTREAWK